MNAVESSARRDLGRFCPWYELARAHQHAPRAPGVFQVRRQDGLTLYPRGRSAMILYGHAQDLQEMLSGYARRYASEDWLCRHQETQDSARARTLHDQVLERFVARFGGPPVLPDTGTTSTPNHDRDPSVKTHE